VERHVVIFGFHNVSPSWLAPCEPGAALRGLETQCRFLRAAFNVLPLADALDRLTAGRSLPRRAAAITFDDGYRDNLDVAAPVLARHGLPATVFLVPGLLSNETRAWWEVAAWAVTHARHPQLAWGDQVLPLRHAAQRRRAARAVLRDLKRRTAADREAALDALIDRLGAPRADAGDRLFLDWDGAARLARAPGISIGSHTVSHPILSREHPETQRHELADSRTSLEAVLDVPVRHVAFPNGTAADYDRHTIAAAREAGYSHAVTTRLGINGPATPPYELRRLMVRPETGVPGLARPLARGARRGVDRLRYGGGAAVHGEPSDPLGVLGAAAALAPL
jgi:peptidoglycan/xylan/chitin deacetylase (PgdA/CDA1 family)